MSTKVPVLLSRGMARLVVVDSVAGPFRCEFDGQALATRARHLQSLGATLRRLSSTFRSPVLCINQVGRGQQLLATSSGKQGGQRARRWVVAGMWPVCLPGLAWKFPKSLGHHS